VQRAARLAHPGVAALRDVLTAFEAEGLPSPEEMEAQCQQDIERLRGMQNGGWRLPLLAAGRLDPLQHHPRGPRPAASRAKGFAVPGDESNSVLDYLRQIESHYPTGTASGRAGP
jgi:alpha-2-macroglobulin